MSSTRGKKVTERRRRVRLRDRANIDVPVARTRTYMLRRLPPRTRVGTDTAIFAAALVNYIAAEVLDKAGKMVPLDRQRITPRTIMEGVRTDDELRPLWPVV